MDSTNMKNAIRRTLSLMDTALGKYLSEDAVILIHRTALVETNYRYIRQMGEGPARGFWQVEPDTANDILFRYLLRQSKSALRTGITRACGLPQMWAFDNEQNVIRSDQNMPPDLLNHYLETNIALGIVLCRLRYWTQPGSGPIPPADHLMDQAEYWKRWYNTPKGAGTSEKFFRIVESHEGKR